MNEVTTGLTATITNRPTVNYEIIDLPYYTLDRFLPEHWDHEHFILSLTNAKNIVYFQYAHCEALGHRVCYSYCDELIKANANFVAILRTIASDDQEETENTNFKERNS